MDKRLYSHLYQAINMNKFPGETPLPGKTVAQQAKAVDYQDIPRDIQAMREATYNREVKRGEFVPEFSGTKKSSLGSYLGDAAKKTMPGVLLVATLFAAYYLFFRKNPDEEVESIEEVEIEDDLEPEDTSEEFDGAGDVEPEPIVTSSYRRRRHF